MRTFISSFFILATTTAGCGGKISSSLSDTAAPDGEETEVEDDAGGDTDGDTEQGGTDTGSTDTGVADDAGDGDGGSDGFVPEGGTDVADMQQGSLAEGTPVTLNNVIVTSTMSIEAPGFYVQDVGGGEWSGVFVFTQAIETAAGLPEPAALSVNVGDVLNLSGTAQEYWDETQLVVASMDDVERLGTSAEVTATMLDAPPSSWEPYEGVLVSLADVNITDVPAPEADGGGETAPVTNWSLSVADKFMPIEMETGDSFSSVTGIVTFSWELFRIAPRTAADLAE